MPRPTLVGANPGVTLFRSATSDERIAVASVWRVDWSSRGAGHALVLWHDGHVRVLAEQPDLGGWLADGYTRHFPETAGLPWPDPIVEPAVVQWRLDLSAGFSASAGDVRVEISEPLDHRTIHVDAFTLGDRDESLSNVFVPCRIATIAVSGTRIAGVPHVDGRSSSAFLAEAEVWTSLEP